MIEFGSRRIVRITRETLDGSFGCDRGRKLVVRLLPHDVIEIRPYGTTRPMHGTVNDVYRFLVRRAANAALLEKARARKELKVQQLARQRLRRAERRLYAKDIHQS
jgi:hypothetical protein